MEIEVKIGKNSFIFESWQEVPNTLKQFRRVKKFRGKYDLIHTGIKLSPEPEHSKSKLVLANISIIWIFLPKLKQIYSQVYPNQTEYNKMEMEEYKNHIDQFLLRANNFTAFI